MDYTSLAKNLRLCAERGAEREPGGCWGCGYDDTCIGVLLMETADAIEALQRACANYAEQACENETKWIPVTERLPLYGEDVLAVRTYGDGEKCREVLMAHIAVWNEETGEKWWNTTNITHWMPLPEPPKEET